jgi:cell division protein FtsQ
MRPNEQKYLNKKAKPKSKVKPLKEADAFLFERRLKFFVNKSLRVITIVSVLGIFGIGTYLYKSEKYILVQNYFSTIFEKFFISQGLRLEQIEVKGTKKITEVEVFEKINEVLANLNEASLTHLPMEDIKKNIELLGWVKTADITKKFPNKLIVNITERAPKAIWQDKTELWLVDDLGNLISDKIEKEYIKLPVLVSKNPLETVPALFEIINKHDIFGTNVVSAVRVGDRRWDIYLQNKIVIKLPEKDVDVAVERLKKLQKRKNILERNIKYVDLRLPDRIAVKKLGESDLVSEKPPVSLGSMYTKSDNNKTNDAAENIIKSTSEKSSPEKAGVEKTTTEKTTTEKTAAEKSSAENTKNKEAKKFEQPAKPASQSPESSKKPQISDDEETTFFDKIEGIVGN